MENSYNVLELKFNGDMSQVCKALKFYLEKNEYEASPIYDDSYQYSYFGKDPSLYCGYTWKFLIKEQSLFILSFIDQRKFFKNKKYASDNKIYNTDYTDINNKRFALIDMQKGTTRALEILVNYFKENKFEFTYNESIFPENDIPSFESDKNLFFPSLDNTTQHWVNNIKLLELYWLFQSQ